MLEVRRKGDRGRMEVRLLLASERETTFDGCAEVVLVGVLFLCGGSTER